MSDFEERVRRGLETVARTVPVGAPGDRHDRWSMQRIVVLSVAATLVAVLVPLGIIAAMKPGAGPAGPVAQTTSTSTASDTPSDTPSESPSSATATSLPDEALYQECEQLVPGSPDVVGEVALQDGSGTTVVVAGPQGTWTCNLWPDTAVSRKGPSKEDVAASPGLQSYAVAFGSASNFHIGWKGDYVWAGGAAPSDDSLIVFTFPDGAIVPATVQNGYWVMQYHSPKGFVRPGHPIFEADPILVTVDGRKIHLAWDTQSICNQISHGC